LQKEEAKGVKPSIQPRPPRSLQMNTTKIIKHKQNVN